MSKSKVPCLVFKAYSTLLLPHPRLPPALPLPGPPYGPPYAGSNQLLPCSPGRSCSRPSAQAEGISPRSPPGPPSVPVRLWLGLFGCWKAPSPDCSLPQGGTQACLAPLCLTAPAVPGHLPRMWPWEHQGAPTDRWLCPGAESLAFQLLSQKPCGGLNGISRGAASGWGRCLVASRAKLLNERCWLIYMLSEFLNLSEPVSSSVFWGYEQH